MDITLHSGESVAIISTDGGYVTNLADNRGDILFPKRLIQGADGTEKTRGGCHVCLPNFGPGGASGLAQHGYGRTSVWSIDEQSAASVSLVCAGQGDYESMISRLHYEVHERVFAMTLTLINEGSGSLNVSPAFHPYFMRGSGSIILNDTTYDDFAEFADTIFIDGTRQRLKTPDRTLHVQSEKLSRWAVWTDQLGDYICVEPTQSGYAFAEDIARADRLAAGESRTYSCQISW
jgi:galactose mutarotase-like enzyme